MQKDLISRQEAIDTIMGQPPEPHYPAWYAAQIEGLPPAQLEPHWIPCEEEMPKEKDAGVLQKIGIQNKSDNVFVTIDTEKGKMVGIACTWDGIWKWDGIFAFPKWKVIAWMPFPAPYQKGDNYVI